MKALRAYVRIFLFILTISFYISWCIVNKIFYQDFMRRNKGVRKRWIGVAVKILGFEAEVKGSIPDAQQVCLVISNHRSFSDPLIILHYLDVFPLAKAEVSSYPFIGFGARITGVLFVSRESMKSRKGAREAISQTLASGQNVLVYPEGTTGTEPTTRGFKRGSFEVAHQLELPILPVAIEYEDVDHHWDKRSLWEQYMLQFGERKCRCKITLGELLPAEGEAYGSVKTRAIIDDFIRVSRSEYSEATTTSVAG